MNLIQMIEAVNRRLDNLSGQTSHYKGAQAGDFTTTTLPHHGDYGFQTTDSELQMNCNGTIRATAMATL